MFDVRRVRCLNNKEISKDTVVYWMSRDQRVQDNWSLLYAQKIANEFEVPLVVVFTMKPNFLDATRRQYDFMITGLMECEQELHDLNIPFFVVVGDKISGLLEFLQNIKAGLVVTDFDPLKIKIKWQNELVQKYKKPIHQVDAHNIVPCWLASNKKEFGAYTLRPKIHRLLDDYLTDFPVISKQKITNLNPKNNWDDIKQSLNIDESVREVDWLSAGAQSGLKSLKYFVNKGLENYNLLRNNPNEKGQSNLSPYLHFGQVSAQRVVLEAYKSKASLESKKVFVEEVLVRRELADNFCCYSSDYDNTNGFPTWSQKSLDEHRSDQRDYVYTIEQFENAITHDELWNAAQLEMKITGKMHGYMRMYWAKKILEWTMSPEVAMKIAIKLNDKYQLDGRDPNGYAGIAWSIGGVHDRAWFERDVYGKVRYMNYNGCKSKFDVARYIAKYTK